jgi:hypothetical protein
MWVSSGFWSKVCDYNAVQSPLQVPNPPWKPPWKIRSHLTPDFAFLNPGQFSEDRFHCFAQFHVIENCKDSPSSVLAGTGKDSYNKLIQVGCFLFKLPPLSSTVGGDAYDPASRDHFGDDVETNLSSQSLFLEGPSTCTCTVQARKHPSPSRLSGRQGAYSTRPGAAVGSETQRHGSFSGSLALRSRHSGLHVLVYNL